MLSWFCFFDKRCPIITLVWIFTPKIIGNVFAGILIIINNESPQNVLAYRALLLFNHYLKNEKKKNFKASHSGAQDRCEKVEYLYKLNFYLKKTFIWHSGRNMNVLGTFALSCASTGKSLLLYLTLKNQRDFHFNFADY